MRKSLIVGTIVLIAMLPGCSDQNETRTAMKPTDEATVSPSERRATIRMETPPSATPAQPPAVASAPAGFVSEATWAGDWPFTVSDGVLMCGQPQRVTFTSGRTIYALNGAATAAGDFDDVAAIWKDSSFPGIKVNITPMIERGLSLC